MGENSKISWTTHTFNPWIGCTELGPGCDHCYARTFVLGRMAHMGIGWGVGAPRHRTAPTTWDNIRKLNRRAIKKGVRESVFIASLADVFDTEVDSDWLRDTFDLVRECPGLDFILVTKRAAKIERLYFKACGEDPWPRNAMVLITVVNQDEADRDIPEILRAKHVLDIPLVGLSMEPLLGPVDLEYPKAFYPDGPPTCCDGRECGCMGQPAEPPMIYGIGWVITGGESGKHARPADPDWFRWIRDQCAAAGVPYHHKQNGEWIGVEALRGMPGGGGPGFGSYDHCAHDQDTETVRVGKKAADRLLDGMTHDARPTL